MTFPISRYDQIVEETIAKIKELGVKKGHEYAGDIDRLANFRRNGKKWKVLMEQCWGIYVSKHWDAVVQYVEDLVEGKKNIQRLENLADRVDDIIVYLLLFKCMLEEREHQKADIEELRKGVLQKREPGEYRGRIMPPVSGDDTKL